MLPSRGHATQIFTSRRYATETSVAHRIECLFFLRLERSHEQLPEEFGRALKSQPFLAVSVRLHAQSFEIERLLVGSNHHSLVHAAMAWLVGHRILDALAAHRTSAERD
jgi:hypothetical protein